LIARKNFLRVRDRRIATGLTVALEDRRSAQIRFDATHVTAGAAPSSNIENRVSKFWRKSTATNKQVLI
jgi:hypothetical protein